MCISMAREHSRHLHTTHPAGTAPQPKTGWCINSVTLFEYTEHVWHFHKKSKTWAVCCALATASLQHQDVNYDIFKIDKVVF